MRQPDRRHFDVRRDLPVRLRKDLGRLGQDHWAGAASIAPVARQERFSDNVQIRRGQRRSLPALNGHALERNSRGKPQPAIVAGQELQQAWHGRLGAAVDEGFAGAAGDRGICVLDQSHERRTHLESLVKAKQMRGERADGGVARIRRFQQETQIGLGSQLVKQRQRSQRGRRVLAPHGFGQARFPLRTGGGFHASGNLAGPRRFDLRQLEQLGHAVGLGRFARCHRNSGGGRRRLRLRGRPS